ncbi:hypothetical protein FRC17_006872 [Serendipita sp. 399]|nr:hypothetical protein FRC17_006872 [Serendipita sp. 399]
MAAKENGESIYECLVPDCEKLSPTPNQRKRHLINDHSFDEKFFFSVIKYGISAQIRAWATQTTTAPSSTKAMLNKPTDAKPPGDSSIERSRSRSRIKPEKSALSSRTSGSRSHRDRDPSADGLMQLIHPVSINEQSNRRNQFSPGTPSFSESAHTSSSSRKTPLSATTTFDTSTSNSGVDGRDYPTDDDYEEEDDDEDDVLPDSSPERVVDTTGEGEVELLDEGKTTLDQVVDRMQADVVVGVQLAFTAMMKLRAVDIEAREKIGNRHLGDEGEDEGDHPS